MSMVNEWQHLKIPFDVIELATENFKTLIGRGGYGSVFKGKLLVSGKETTVAVKRLNEQFGQGLKEFLTEIHLLSGQQHPNLISLVGFCDEGREKSIVYEYAERGSLDKYIRRTRKTTSTTLTWLQRLQICVDAARGLDHLHNHVGGHRTIIHRDIKSSNILIDDNWVAKISDLGLSKLSVSGFGMSDIVSNGCGTPGYCEPEYSTTGILTKKSDVYSFGVVLFEVLCGRLCLNDSDDGFLLSSKSAKYHYKKNSLDKIIDDSLREHIGSYSMTNFAAIAYRCLHDDREQRPAMDVVLKELKEALKYQIHIAHAEFSPLQIPLLDLENATSNFAAEKLINKGKFWKDYEGQMHLCGQLTDIVARKLDAMYGNEVDFLGAISIYSSLKHKNIVFYIGFCNENNEKIIIYEHAAHGSLDQYISDITLTWFQRLQICLGVARALSHIHCDVIHCDINSSNIFLDEDWEAKLFGFELSTKYPESWRHRLLFSRHCDTSDYIDPVYLKNATVTPKYDVYSFGIVLFEVLCGRKAMIGEDGVDQSLAAMAKRHYEEGKLDEIIVEGLRRQMDSESLTIFSSTAYNCLRERVYRPTMDEVVRDLEEALEHLWKHENIEHSAEAYDDISSNHLKREYLECLRIPFSDIKLATDCFNTEFCIGSGGYGMVYKADLEHLDQERFSSAMQGKNKLELPKRRSTVAIKRILHRQDEQGKQGFLAEIELLTSCKHQNIVSLLGFASKDREMILVYEFLVNGSLDHYFGGYEKKTNFTWNQRIQICLNIAEGLQYLHTSIEEKPRIIHQDIKSANVLLDENWNAKISDFGLSEFHPENQLVSSNETNVIKGTEVYLDPEYATTGRCKKESDIYSFGVVLFEILSGTLAYDSVYLDENHKGLAPIARRRFNEGTLKELIDPTMMDEDDEQRFTLNRGPNQDSFDAFTRIAYKCLAETQAKRPPMEVIIKELRNALSLQGETMVLFRFRLTDIVQATEAFKETYRIGFDAYGIVYKAELDHFESGSSSLIEKAKERISVAIKRISCSEVGQGGQGFFEEIEMCTRYKHPNIVSLLGFCDEGREMIIVYEHASNGSLDDYLGRNDDWNMLTWAQRLCKCLEIANGLNHLHTKMGSKQTIVHGDIRSANILFDKNFVAKIAYFGLSMPHPANKANTIVYLDPEYEITGKLEIKSDIYSFGVVLFEILCGRLAYDLIYTGSDKGLASMARQCCNDGTIKKMIDHKLLEETKEDDSTANKGPNQDSLDTFLKVAYQCLEITQTERPTMETVITELKKALYYQEEDKEIWEAILPRNYKEIIDISETPEIYLNTKKKDLYKMLSEGIYLLEGKVWFSLSKNGKANKMISATTFSYRNRAAHKWTGIQKSRLCRFQKVAKMTDITNLKIRIKMKAEYLSMDTVYGVHLVFMFCDSRKVSSNPIYVNLKYKTGSETSHAYFAKHRDDDGWMMIELYRFLNQEKVSDFEVSLESFSRYYCGKGDIYVQGIEFQAIENMKDEEIMILKGTQQVPKSDVKKDQMQQMPKNLGETFMGSEHDYDETKIFLQTEVNGKKHLLISATEVLFNSTEMKPFHLKPSAESRFQNVMELLQQQVFRIKYKIESEKLSPSTEYACYLVFKLSEKCRELHCPVKVRDLLHRKKKDTKTLYFRSPAPLNQHDGNSVPIQRKDGWKEVMVWKFNSKYMLANNLIPVNLKVVTYEGTMSGLIICGLDFRPV